jgi:SAM-dependent methyltransferase
LPGSNLREIAPNLELSHNGWWSSRQLSEVSYPEDGNALCFLVEDSSFWFEHRNRCILEAIRLLPPPGTFFDVGGGNGCVARAIQQTGRDVVLVEPGLAGVRNAVNRGIRQVVRATLDDAGVLAETLPAVGLFDVVEHISDDSGFMARMNRLVAPGGRVYITVPACQWLWSNEDTLSGHSRRYTVPALRRLLEHTGYTVELATYFFGFLPLPILLRRVMPYRLGFAAKQIAEITVRSEHELGNPLARRILRVLTRRELSRIAERRPVRMGGSCLAVARKGPDPGASRQHDTSFHNR